MTFKTRELKFGIKDKKLFNEEEIKAALKAQGFPGAEVKAGPT
jgi:hypothetical protein